MKMTNVFLASLLSKLGHEVKAELVIDDSNGLSLTFPDISDMSEIADGVAIDAPDGTYVVADGDKTHTLVVVAGIVTQHTEDVPVAAAEVPVLGAEVEAVLEAVVEAHKALKAQFVVLQKDHNTLKVSLKHGEETSKVATTSTDSSTKYKIV